MASIMRGSIAHGSPIANWWKVSIDILHELMWNLVKVRVEVVVADVRLGLYRDTENDDD